MEFQPFFVVVWFSNIDNLEVDFGLKIGALEVDLVCILMWNKIPGWNYKKWWFGKTQNGERTFNQ